MHRTATSYQWNLGGLPWIGGQTIEQGYSATAAGDYTVTVGDANGLFKYFCHYNIIEFPECHSGHKRVFNNL